MINRLLIIPLVFMTMSFSAANTFAAVAPVSATGGGTTIASLTAMLEHQRAGLTKEQMMMMMDNMMKIEAR